MSEPSPFLPTTAELKALPEASDALPVGAHLAEFEVREVIGVGGFGIVYRAWDSALEREVAVKEYMPMGLVGRGADGRATLRSRGYEEDFTLGLRSFVNEARLLARFDHPSLVKVYRFWEANGTAYMAMPFYQAQTLRQRRQDMGAQVPTQEWLLSMIQPLLGALEEMHRADVYHRDIAPDNILWCADSRPVLLDFGAARHALTDRTQALTAILKPQFAPIEQYADAQSMRQGPWTDVFALASTCYFMVTGRPPLPATARILNDDLAPLAQLAPEGFSPHVLATLDWAMAVRPRERPQSVAILQDALLGLLPVPERVEHEPAAPHVGDITGANFERTIQTAPRTDVEASGGRERTEAPRAVTRTMPAGTSMPPGRSPIRSALLLCAVVAAAGVAWLRPWHHRVDPAASAPAAVALPATSASAGEISAPAASAIGAAAPAPVAADSATQATPPQRVAQVAGARASAAARRSRMLAAAVGENASRDAARGSRTAANEDATTRAAREEVAWAAAHEETPVARTARLAAAGTGPREACIESEPSNVSACVKRVCQSDSRFSRYPSCVHL